MAGDWEANEERPRLHCLIVDLVGRFSAENPAVPDEPNLIDTDELINCGRKDGGRTDFQPGWLGPQVREAARIPRSFIAAMTETVGRDRALPIGWRSGSMA